MTFDKAYWIRRRGYYKGRLTYYGNEFVSEGVEVSIGALESILVRLKDVYVKFNEAQDNLEQNSPGDDDVEEREMFDNDYHALEREVLMLIQEKKSKLNVTVTSPKLPDISVPKFDGNHLHWLSFRDCFKQLVGEAKLDSVTKYRYLENSLIGSKALDIVRSLTTTDYETAWTHLLEEYDNVTTITDKHMKALYDADVAKKDNADSLQKFLDTIESNLSALKSLNQPVDQWDLLLVHHLSQKLDVQSRRELEKIKKPTTQLKFTEFKAFLKSRIRMLHAISDFSSPPLASSTPKSIKLDKQFKSKSFVTSAEKLKKCHLCAGNHIVQDCPDVKGKSFQELNNYIQSKKLCYNCLRPNHFVDCCTNSFRCKICSRKHHTILHNGSVSETNNTKPSSSKQIESSNAAVSYCTSTTNVVLLATAVVYIKNHKGEYVLCRAVLDNASTTCFITEELVQKLGLKKQYSYTVVNGVNATETSNKFQTSAVVKSRVSNYEVDLDFVISKKIVGDLPVAQVDVSQWSLPSQDELADPYFNAPEKIDMLLGSEVFFTIITGEKKQIDDNLWLFSTELGYIVGGKVGKSKQSHSYCTVEQLKLEIQKFWETESVDLVQNYSPDEQAAENNYAKTVVRQEDGRYSVALPLKPNISKLGDSKTKAQQFFLASEARLIKNPSKHSHYQEFMQEMIDLNHMSEASEDSPIQNYIVHHLISRPSSSTTKHRVVFNASFKTSSGYSLNDMLYVGPTIQADVFVHLCHWRKYPIALIADIAKMYRQILIHDEHRDYQRIWWRSDPNSKLKSYRLNTVTYGTASAPFQAIRTLTQLAQDENESNPIASQLLTQNFYVDDFVSSFDSEQTAQEAKNDLNQITRKGGLQLRKWNSNLESLIENSEEPNQVTVLGIKWNRESDQLIMSFNDIQFREKITKASILSEIAQLYDPLGLCSPIVLTAKLIMQCLWSKINVDWQEDLPQEFIERWINFQNQLKQMIPLQIPRTLIESINCKIELHGFADASEHAYGACIYLRIIDIDSIKMKLVCAKSRVAPLKRMTIPRLELCAALVLSRLVKKVKNALQIPEIKTYLWSDSEITLFRIKSTSSRYNTFVGTRLASIHENTIASDWYHIPSKENPADVISRGLMPSELNESELWWSGPAFLRELSSDWPKQTKFDIKEDEKEIRKFNYVFVTLPIVDDNIIIRQHSFDKLLGVVAYLIRFMINSKKPKRYRSYDVLRPIERQDALFRVIRIVQLIEFEDDIKDLKNHKPVKVSSRLKNLNPFIDEDNLVRVGGRLENSELSWDNQHQIIISSNHHLAVLIVRNIHEKNMHCGPQSLLNTVRQNYWIIGGRSLCKKIVRNCVTCFRRRPIMLKQIMGQLPEGRVKIARPFEKVGVDFCGPFLIKYNVRTKTYSKAYVALWSCFVTRATHLEVVHDLTTQSFLAALKRFVSRRGIPTEIYSDNATNFTGASKELEALKKAFSSQDHIQEVLSFCFNENIQWKFIPPRSPHFGALYESIIKQAKYHLKRVTNELVFTTEQLDTIICQVECCLNSRPLTPISEDINDYQALTPGHFLIGQPLNAIPEPSLLPIKFNRLSLWQQVQQTVQKFWSKWSVDYLNELQQRKKWQKIQQNVKIGDLVLLFEENLPPTQWLLARVIKIYPGQDNVIRVVDIKTKNGIFKRSITKLAMLPVD